MFITVLGSSSGQAVASRNPSALLVEAPDTTLLIAELETVGIKSPLSLEILAPILAFYPVKDVFYADLTLEVLVMTFVLGTLISVLASFYPARKAARLNPTDALRHI